MALSSPSARSPRSVAGRRARPARPPEARGTLVLIRSDCFLAQTTRARAPLAAKAVRTEQKNRHTFVVSRHGIFRVVNSGSRALKPSAERRARCSRRAPAGPHPAAPAPQLPRTTLIRASSSHSSFAD